MNSRHDDTFGSHSHPTQVELHGLHARITRLARMRRHVLLKRKRNQLNRISSALLLERIEEDEMKTISRMTTIRQGQSSIYDLDHVGNSVQTNGDDQTAEEDILKATLTRLARKKRRVILKTKRRQITETSSAMLLKQIAADELKMKSKMQSAIQASRFQTELRRRRGHSRSNREDLLDSNYQNAEGAIMDDDEMSHLSGDDGTIEEQTVNGSRSEVFTLGTPNCICEDCGAIFWYQERNSRSTNPVKPKFSLCCMAGKVQLPLLKGTPYPLSNLLNPNGGIHSQHFRENIRAYNSIFAFTSMGGTVENAINKGPAPYAFKISGQNHHRLGSLLPMPDQKPKFAQLYIYDTQNETTNRIDALSSSPQTSNLNTAIIDQLTAMLNEHNPLVQSFRIARDRFKDENVPELRLRLIGRRQQDGREYNLPTASEVAGIVVGDIDGHSDKRDIIVEHRTGVLKRITELHPSFMALQYPLLFPFGEDGYRIDITFREDTTARRKRNKVTMREYYAFRIQQRINEGHTILLAGRLLQQFLVDAYSCIEEERLRWIRLNQGKLRIDLLQGLMDAILRGDCITNDVGIRTIMPSSVIGSPRSRVQNYQDAMAICRWAGFPDLFITFTCNPKWPEIMEMIKLIGLHSPSDRIDVVVRVFEARVWELINDLKRKQRFGRAIAIVYTVEFQKRGLPHIHILLFLHPDDKPRSTAQIDNIISAEIPDKEKDPMAYSMVQQFMTHGPCGSKKPSSPCMVNGKCTKHFPKRFQEATSIDESGFPIYKRRTNGDFVLKSGLKLDNRYVVPYNRDLIVKFNAHINVELCNHSRAIKYLFKYIHKNPDRSTVVLEEGANIDEIKTFLDCRYISAAEACWRIFKYELQYREPAVERLPFHLENQQTIYFPDGESVEHVVQRPAIGKTMFTEWMSTNKQYVDAQKLTYAEFPSEWVWHQADKQWKPRKGKKSIGRIYFAHPSSGEKYYLRMLLNVVKGCTSFEDIRTVNGVIYPTFKEACQALGLLDDDREWDECIKEASLWATGSQLRQLFATILSNCEVASPANLWEENWVILSEDFTQRKKNPLLFDGIQLSDDQKKLYALLEIDRILNKNNFSLTDIPGMPTADVDLQNDINNRLLAEELSYNICALREEHNNLLHGLNDKQRNAYNDILQSVYNNEGKLFFIYGHGGTGKTFLWRTIISRLRSEGKIVLNCASSGIAALLMAGGKTAHSRFKIPLNPTSESTCAIKKGTQLAELIMSASLIIWDEAPMADKACFEALDKTLRDILTTKFADSENKLFGGITVALGGDFRQILPVIPKGRRSDIINAAITSSHLWEYCTVHMLTQNMRLTSVITEGIEQAKAREFSNWILQVGNGVSDNSDGEEWIPILPDLLPPNRGSPLHSIVQSTYPSLPNNYMNAEYLIERSILAVRNDTVNEINSFIMDQLPNEEMIFRSSDSISKAGPTYHDQDLLYPTEFLNKLNFPGFPPHELKLTDNIPVMLIRNIDQNGGLCNGTRLIITQLGRWFVKGKIMTGKNIGQEVFIPRITLSPNDSKLPFIFKRRQFPIIVAFAMTINKSQGQSLRNVGLFLTKQVFTHGQLYVAISRVTSRAGLKILSTDDRGEPITEVKNIVYKEIFNNIKC